MPHPDPSDLSTLRLLELEGAIDGVLCSVAKVSTVKESQKVEARMRKVITAAWQSVANETLISSIRALRKGPYTQKRIGSFLKRFGLKLKDPLTQEQVAFVERRVSEIYRIAKKIGAKEAKFKPVFDLIDKRAVKAINRQQMFWVGDFYSDKLSRRIRGVSEDVLLRQGLAHGEAGDVLHKALRQEFGLVEAAQSPTTFAPNIPARYAGRSELYMRQVTSTAAHQARTFGRLTAYGQGGIRRFRLTNPLDDRTGKVCNQIANQIITVPAATAQMNNILAAKTPKEVKAAAPWLSEKQLLGVLGGAKAGSAEATRRLEAAAAQGDATMIPPFHGLCLLADTPVVTEAGLVPVQKVRIGDRVLTHKGRFRRVVDSFKHQVTGTFMEIVVQSVKIGITSNHPVLEADNESFIPAGKLKPGSWVKAASKPLQDLQYQDVRGSLKSSCAMLFEEMPICCQRALERQKEVSNNRACIAYLLAMWRTICEESQQAYRQQQGTVLQQEMQNRISGSIYCADLYCLWCGLLCVALQNRAADLLFCLPQYFDAHWQKKIRTDKAEAVWQKQPYVCQKSDSEEVDRSAYRAQWYCKGEGSARSRGCQTDRQPWITDAIRAKEILSLVGSYLCPRFLYSGTRSLDRSRGWLEATKEKVPAAFQSVDREFLGCIGLQGYNIGSYPVEYVTRYQVTQLPVFNLEVEDDHTYVAGGVVVHNCRTEMVVVS